LDLDTFARYAVGIWLAVMAVCLLIELCTNSRWLLWPAGSAAATAVVAKLWFFTPQIQLLVFAGLTLVSTVIGRRLTDDGPRREAQDREDALERVVGLSGTASATFKKGLGRVRVDGHEWPAEQEDRAPLKRGDKIYVVAVKGRSRLKVRCAGS
jgi:membrane protein implicated in regulation of membrane protease activity